LVAIFVDLSYKENFDKVLLDSSFSEIDTSSISDSNGNAEDLLNKIAIKKDKLEFEIKAKKNTLNKITSKHSDYILDAEKFLSIEADKAQLPLSFGATRETFFLRCYLPKTDVEKAKTELAKSTGNKIHILEEDLGNDEEIPIKLNNSKYIKNFEFFTKLFALPKYNEFDPTFLMAFTFPIFISNLSVILSNFSFYDGIVDISKI